MQVVNASDHFDNLPILVVIRSSRETLIAIAKEVKLKLDNEIPYRRLVANPPKAAPLIAKK
jgi:hypothetical protein